MTTITKACSIFFSPTHTSQKVANAVVKGTGIASVSQQNLTVLPVSPIHLTTDTLTVFAAPVYGGHIPPVAVERIKRRADSGYCNGSVWKPGLRTRFGRTLRTG